MTIMPDELTPLIRFLQEAPRTYEDLRGFLHYEDKTIYNYMTRVRRLGYTIESRGVNNRPRRYRITKESSNETHS